MKILKSILIALILSTSFIPSIEAKTVGDLKEELKIKKEEYANNQHQKNLTEEEMENIRNNINKINDEVENITKTMLELTNEIEELGNKIIEKKEELNKIINFQQISNSESMYMEYVFGASTFTDFIYRVAVAEQLSKYTDSLIKEYNDMIKANNDKKIQLQNKQIELQNKQKSLEKELEKLGEQINSYEKETLSIDSEIQSLEEAIDVYQNQYGCTDTDDIDICTREKLPADTAFYRPIVTGSVTTDWEYYAPFGKKVFHYALDFAAYDDGSSIPVYSMAAGVVVSKFRQDCGNNIIVITHNVNGESYTSTYWHLRSTNVNVGDTVTKDTKIGVMGGALYDSDTCSTGLHVHITISTGLYLTDYHSFNTLNARRFNPRLVLNAPAKYVIFRDRTTKY